jgi:asparagine synthase (glutamine-hydrolysing)
MCGIFGALNINSSLNNLENFKSNFYKGQRRGPDDTKFIIYYKELFGFHRLAINGLNDVSNQPIIIDNVFLICNGEIYNYKELYRLLNIEPTTSSDCEVIIHLYLKYGIEHIFNYLDGVFSFILYDMRIIDGEPCKIFVARDPYGVRPLYVLEHKTNFVYAFASELKCLSGLYKNQNSNSFHISQFKPGTYSEYDFNGGKVNAQWIEKSKNIPYIIPTFAYSIITAFDKKFINDPETFLYKYELPYIYKNISYYLTCAVYKRFMNTDRPIACLLSGGLDSSLVTAITNQLQKTYNPFVKLKTFSIGLKGSVDLKYARLVADYLETDHTEIIITEQEMFDVIPEVIYAIESYDTTSVRASIGNYLLGKYISTHCDSKVILNGDGSDELFGGYLYMNKCPDDIQFDIETRRLLKDIHYFDVLRSDKCISSHGLEPRTPFLDKSFVNYVLSIPSYIRNHVNFNQIEKYLLRSSFLPVYFETNDGKPLLPNEIIMRKKEAFSDGVSSQNGSSLYAILQDKIRLKYLLEEEKEKEIPFESGIEMEKEYYKSIFKKFFPDALDIVPYLWMPQFIEEATDPSARTLKIYHE